MSWITLALLGLFLALSPTPTPASPPEACAEVRQEMMGRMARLDSTLKIRQAYLLGEIKQSGPALRQCIELNDSVSIRALLLWIVSGLSLLALMGLTFWNTRLNRRAIAVLSAAVHRIDASHPESYQPNQWPHHLQWGVLILCLIGITFLALFF